MTRNHPIIGLDRHRRPTHYADFHRVKNRLELDVYYSALRAQEKRANLLQDRQRVNELIERHTGAFSKTFLAERRKRLAEQLGETLPS